MKTTDKPDEKILGVADCISEIPSSAKPGMLVPGRIDASRALLEQMDEEAGLAPKDLTAVVDVLHQADLSRRVVSLIPIGNIKG